MAQTPEQVTNMASPPECTVETTISAEHWMSTLPLPSLQLPITKLFIPGTHDSGTYECSSELAPDADSTLAALEKISCLEPLVNSIIQRWAKCQDLTFAQQLVGGIRYFDLRVALNPSSEEFYLVHSVYAAKVSDLVNAVKTFLESHPHEVVLLDFNHFYAMEEEHHVQLVTYLLSVFGSSICNRCDLTQLSLHSLWDHQKQVIMFYQNKAGEQFEEVWPGDRIDNFWPNTDNPQECMKLIEQHFSARLQKDFNVCQGVLTPTTALILETILTGGSVQSLSGKLLPLLSSWVDKLPGCVPYPPCIVTADFIESQGLIQKIIALNYRESQLQSS